MNIFQALGIGLGIGLFFMMALLFFGYEDMINNIDSSDPKAEVVHKVVYKDRIIYVEDSPPLPEEPPLVDPETLECMAMNLYYEAANQSRLGMIAIARVVVNRVEHPFYPASVCSVVKQGSLKDGKIYATYKNEQGETVQVPSCQFSWYCDGKADVIPRDKHNTPWQIANAVAREVLAHDKWRGIVEGATHYHADYVDPKWRYMENMTPITSVDNHLFYRWER